MIHVGLMTSNLYAKFAGTMMLSIFENHTPPHLPSITIHIFHDDTFINENREKFSWLAGQYGQAVKFYNVEELCADKIAEFRYLMPNLVNHNKYPLVALYRLLFPQILSNEIDKCIALDSDIIINMDIAEFWQVDLNDKLLGVIPEILNRDDVREGFTLVSDGLVKENDYFNAGILLMNLNPLRKEYDHMKVGMKFVSKNPRYTAFQEQEIWNYCFSTKTLKLPIKFNQFVCTARANSKNKPNVERKNYHYCASPVGIGLGLNVNDPFNRLWMSYFIKTPWFSEDAIGRLYAGVQELHVGLKQSMINISAMMSGKIRAFFVAPGDVDTVKEIFSVRKDEEIIRAESEASLKKLINAMKKSRGKKVFFIMLPIFPFQTLIDAGFEVGKDFVNGVEFLSEAHGVPFNSFPLILAM